MCHRKLNVLYRPLFSAIILLCIPTISGILTSPGSPAKVQLSSTSVTVRWSYEDTAVPGLYFAVEVYNSSAGVSTARTYTSTDVVYTISDLTAGTTYVLSVTALNGTDQSDATAAFTFTTPADRPRAPSSLYTVSKTGESLTVAWTAASDGGSSLAGYQVFFMHAVYDSAWMCGANALLVRNTSARGYRAAALAPNTMYCVMIRAVNKVGVSDYSKPLMERTSAVPTAVNGSRFVSSTAHSITIAYDTPVDNDSPIVLYRVDIRLAAANAATLWTVSGTTEQLTFTAERLSPMTPYVFRVVARNSIGWGLPGHTSDAFYTDADVPQAVGALSAVNNTGLEMAISFPPANGNGAPVLGYEVQMTDQPDNPFRVVATISQLALVLTGLSPGTTYYVRVRAYNRVGFGPFGNISLLVSSASAPGAPKDLHVSQTTVESITIAWTASKSNGSPLIFYTVWATQVGPPPRDMYFTLPTSPLRYNLTGLSPGQDFMFRVSCTNVRGRSLWSNTVNVTTDYRPPGVPGRPMAVSVTQESIEVNFTAPDYIGGTPITSYELQRDDGHFGMFDTLLCPGILTTLRCVASGLGAFMYQFRVRARNIAGFSGWSNVTVLATLFDGFSSYDLHSLNLTLVANATLRNTTGDLRLTSPAPNLVGGAWFSNPIDVRCGFDSMFRFRMWEASAQCKFMPYRWCEARGGDGLALVMYAPPASNATTALSNLSFPVGAPASGLGYAGIPSSIAIEFDTAFDPSLEDPLNNHVSVHTCGGDANSAHHRASLGSTANCSGLADGNTHIARVLYWPALNETHMRLRSYRVVPYAMTFLVASVGALLIWLDDMHTPALALPISLDAALSLGPSSQVYIGFTAATGDSFQYHDIVSWQHHSNILPHC